MSDTGDTGDDMPSYDPSAPISVLGDAPMPPWRIDPGQPSIFDDAFNPKPWTLADSSLNFFVDPEAMKTIDFDGTAPPETPPWLNGPDATADGQDQPSQPDASGFTGLTPWRPDVSPDEYLGSAASGSTSPPAAPGSKDGWVQLPQPGDLEAGEGSSGYYTYGTDKSGKPGTGPDAQWGPSKTMQVIDAVAGKLANGDQYTPFGVGNISLQGGADFSGKNGHHDHNDGLSIDVRPARIDGAQESVSYQDPHYDRDATQRLVDAFRSTGQVSKIYFNDPQITGVQPYKGHDNHLHVKLTP